MNPIKNGRITRYLVLFFVIKISLIAPLFAIETQGYKKPSQEMIDLIDVPPTPGVRLSPNSEWLLLLHYPGFPDIEEFTKEELRLAGQEFYPQTNSPARSTYYIDLEFKKLNGNKVYKIKNLPDKIEDVTWSPDGKKIAFTVICENGLELWYANVVSKQAKKLTDAVVNDTYHGYAFTWMPDSKKIIYKSIKTDRGNPPQKDERIVSPKIQENIDGKAPVRTYQSLLEDETDKKLFDYYMTSQLELVDLNGEQRKIGEEAIIRRFTPSPDGKYLLVAKTHKPYSYLVTAWRFPRTIEVWDLKGKKVTTIAEIPLNEDVSPKHGAVREGPRYFQWRADKPATLFWVRALDEGNPDKEVEYREEVLALSAPFSGSARTISKLKLRYSGIYWGKDDLAIIKQYWRPEKRIITSFFNPNKMNEDMQVIFDRNYENAYADPGDFVTKYNSAKRRVLQFDESRDKLYLEGSGAGPEGNKPFLDSYDIKTGKIERLWQSQPPFYEYFVRLISQNPNVILIGRQSKKMPRNYYLKNLETDELTAVTKFSNPQPQFEKVTKKFIKFKREDGLQLFGNLYLPPGYTPGDSTLPVLMNAYPHEYKDASHAGQIKDSPYRFTKVYPWSAEMWAIKGYAIFDKVSMPVVAQGDQPANETFVPQLIKNAEAAIDTLVEMGIADSNRIAIDGHSYGAFMVGNLLAHSDLFAAGIARSGAYNRTLTPFGFQHEDRTFWEAKDTYLSMSPFMYADQVNEPLLLIHGEQDTNSGTFPMQSERFYHALKGNGAPVRLVMLPYEAHSYKARESIFHVIWEIENWLKQHVKQGD
ncbi:MAG: S9 family peptidase [Candidatus Cloacimonetes bacterium]|nr:S9 family peptidase [Candidatus Cloacimonadota bacterium]